MRTSNVTMWSQESQDVHQHRQTSLFAQTPDGRYLGRGRATSTCGSNPSTRPRAPFLTYFACSDISDAPFLRPVACWRSTRPKPLTDGTAPPPAAELASTTVPRHSFPSSFAFFCGNDVLRTLCRPHHFPFIPYVYLKRSAFAALRALLVCCDQTRGKGACGRRRTSPPLRMRPRSMPESSSWEHSLLVVGGGK